jgi:hypothetical protein
MSTSFQKTNVPEQLKLPCLKIKKTGSLKARRPIKAKRQWKLTIFLQLILLKTGTILKLY